MTDLATAPLRLIEALGRLPPRRVAIGLMLVTALVVGLCFDPRVELGGDNALYWALASSLADGEGYRNLVAPGAPPETSVPWGYPALLALPVALGASYVQAKLLGLACMVGAVGFFWAMVRRLLPEQRGIAVLVGVLLAVDEHVLEYASATLSEAPYLLLSMAALWAFDRQTDHRGSVALPALLAGAAYLVRPAGISLVLALMLLLALTRRWRDLGVAAAVLAVVMGSWHAWALFTPSSEENLYLSYLFKEDKFQTGDARIGPMGLVLRVWSNAVAYSTTVLPKFVLGWSWPDKGMGPLVPPFLIALAVGWLSGLRRPRLVHAYLPLYVGVLLAWLPESVNDRYFAIGFPLMVALALPGLWWLIARWSHNAAGWAVVAAAALTIGFRVNHTAGAVLRAFDVRAQVAAGDDLARSPEAFRSYIGMVRGLTDTVAEGSILAARKPRLAWYYSGHQALRVPNGDDPADLLSWLEENHIDYLLLDHIDAVRGRNPTTRERFRVLQTTLPDRFESVLQGSQGDEVLRVLPATAVSGQSPASDSRPL